MGSLDSRQRKKAHTEQLEVTEHRLREEIANLTLQLQRYSIVDQNNRQEQLRLKAEIDRQQGLAEIERQEIIQEMQGTIDALRKQNRALEAKVNQLEASYDCRMPELRPSMDDRSHQDLHLTHLQVAKRSSSHPETVQIPIHNPQSPAASGMLLMVGDPFSLMSVSSNSNSTAPDMRRVCRYAKSTIGSDSHFPTVRRGPRDLHAAAWGPLRQCRCQKAYWGTSCRNRNVYELTDDTVLRQTKPSRYKVVHGGSANLGCQSSIQLRSSRLYIQWTVVSWIICRSVYRSHGSGVRSSAQPTSVTS